MKILVPIKRVPDPDYRVRIREDGTGVEEEDLVQVANPFDLVAVEAALRIREDAAHGSTDVEIAAVSIGRTGDEEGLRAGLAMGVERGLFVRTDAAVDPWGVAALLEGVVERERPDLVLMGKQAIDDDAGQVGPLLAARLEWPQATSVVSMTLEAGSAHVERAIDAGRESLTVTLPAVVTVDLRMLTPRYPSLPQLLAAGRQPLEHIEARALDIPGDPPGEGGCQILSLELLDSARGCEMVDDVDTLVRRLREREVF